MGGVSSAGWVFGSFIFFGEYFKAKVGRKGLVGVGLECVGGKYFGDFE
jgi:hypothetical protein